jgi:hypothetical protein
VPSRVGFPAQKVKSVVQVRRTLVDLVSGKSNGANGGNEHFLKK